MRGGRERKGEVGEVGEVNQGKKERREGKRTREMTDREKEGWWIERW